MKDKRIYLLMEDVEKNALMHILALTYQVASG